MIRQGVLVLGNNTIDHVFAMAAPLPPNAKANARSYRAHAGGQAANMAVALALLGEQVAFAGSFGDDGGAVFCRQAFEAAGIDLGLSVTVPDCRQHLACILVAGDQRGIVMYRDPRLALDDLVLPPEAVAARAAVYSDGHEGPASERLARLAAETATPLIVDIEVVTAHTVVLAASAGHVVAPAEIVRRLGGSDDLPTALRTLLKGGPQAVVATMGGDGALGLSREHGEPVAVPALPCAVVDTTGAGDAFHAGYVASLLRGEPLAQRLRFATAAAAAKCGLAGPRLDGPSCRSLRERYLRMSG